MKYLANILYTIISVTTFMAFTPNEALPNDTKKTSALEASQEIAYTSQQICKAYFYIQQGIRPDGARRELKESLLSLDSNILVLEKTTLDKESSDILLFVKYTLNELKHIINQQYSIENGALVLDISESILEGITLIANKLGQPTTDITSTINRMIFLVERMNKYYIAFRAGFKDENSINQLQKAISSFDSDLKVINNHGEYPEMVKYHQNQINQFWPIAKRFYLGIKKNALPVIVMASTNSLSKHLRNIKLYYLQKNG